MYLIFFFRDITKYIGKMKMTGYKETRNVITFIQYRKYQYFNCDIQKFTCLLAQSFFTNPGSLFHPNVCSFQFVLMAPFNEVLVCKLIGEEKLFIFKVELSKTDKVLINICLSYLYNI
jgi:hypothetical protein